MFENVVRKNTQYESVFRRRLMCESMCMRRSLHKSFLGGSYYMRIYILKVDSEKLYVGG